MSADKFFNLAIETIEEVRESQRESILQAAELIATSILDGGMVHVFGAGHSHILAEEMFYRAGGLVPVNAVLDPNFMLHVPPMKGSRLERLEGYGAIIFQSYQTYPGEVIIVVSQSGKNAAPVEVALKAKEQGLKVVAITSRQHSQAVPPQHSSGKRLYEIADIVIDNRVPIGDAAVVPMEGYPKVAPLSTVVGGAILNAIVAQVAANVAAQGKTPPTWVSANVPGSEKHNRRFMEAYQSRLKSF